ncbi:MAG: DUF445 family protein [Bacillota bacterium]
MPVHLLLIPLIAAAIGWITNVAAVRLLFWPIRPIRLRGTPWAVQGVFPRRQKAIAESIGRLVEEEFLRPQDVMASLNGAVRKEAASALEAYVAERLRKGLPHFLPARVRDAVTGYAADLARREAPGVVSDLAGRLEERIRSELHIGAIIGGRMRSLELGEFERALVRIMGRELRWLEALGAVMGFLIGIVQVLLVWP